MSMYVVLLSDLQNLVHTNWLDYLALAIRVQTTDMNTENQLPNK